MVDGAADGSVNLVSQGADPLERFVGKGLGDCRILRRRHTVGQFPGCFVRREAGTVDIDCHVGAVVLNCLEAADMLAVLASLFGIIDRQVETLLHGSHHRAALADGRVLHGVFHDFAALSGFAEYVLRRYADVVEDNFAEFVLRHGR